MIEQTFIHLPGIGPVRERLLWERGISSWDVFESALRSGVLPRGLFSQNGNVQLSLFSNGSSALSGNGSQNQYTQSADPRVNTWLENIDLSRRALREENYNFFLERLSPSEHWRVLEGRTDNALYLDIETTGLSIELNYMTVIGALHRNKFYQWVWPEPIDELIELIKAAPLVVTFNGRRFDVPFARHWAPTLPSPRAHIDLLYITRSLGISGGLKITEEHFGLIRDESIQGVDGAEAVVMWCKSLWGDKRAYKKLLLYNQTDVEMLPKLAAKLCHEHIARAHGGPVDDTIRVNSRTRFFHRPARFLDLRQAWEHRRSGLHLLTPRLLARLGREPVVVGIDLRGNPKNPTGWSRCQGSNVESRVLHDDDEILALTLSARPDLVSIDAPLSLPRGRFSVSDDSPCREKGGIVRDAERILWSRGIPVYPSLIRHMQGLTQRGITLAGRLRESGIAVIESYPGAAQDILGIPRKRVDLNILRRGLKEFGFETSDDWSHDELDALTSALVGYFYLADEYEAIGADDEGYMIIPRWTAAMRWTNGEGESGGLRRAVCVLGRPGHGKTAFLAGLERRLGWRFVDLSEVATDMKTQQSERGQPDSAHLSSLEELVHQITRDSSIKGLILDGFPQSEHDVRSAWALFDEWSVIYLRSSNVSNHAAYSATTACDSFVSVTGDLLQTSSQVTLSQNELKQGSTKASEVSLGEGHNLDRLLGILTDVEVIELDESRPLDELEDEAVQRILSTRLS